ncbi:MAG: 4Fe-4S binding protein [Nitrososphaerales archaeon]
MNLKKLIQKTRHISQAFFFIFFTAVVVGAVCSFVIGSVEVVEPLGALQILVASGASVPQSTLLVFVSATAIFIFVTILLGRAWCAWACPIGTITEFTEHVMNKRRFKPLVERRPRIPLKAEEGRIWSKEVKYFTLSAVIISSAVTRTPSWCSFCPIGTICRGTVAGSFVAGAEMAIVGAVLAANVYEKRFFCKYICPVAGLLTLISRFNFFMKPRVKREECRSCGACAVICPEGLMVCEEKTFAECTKCFVCYSKCPYGVISIGLTGRK